MSSHLPNHLQLIVDDICGDGCDQVNHIIKTMQEDEVIEAMEALSTVERQLVLDELRDIMAVYEQR
jgi:N-methylhydantoinase B/oxoprolinase/acetone carboxylase alpha subunit